MARHYELKRSFDYRNAMGDTVSEKYESFYVFLMGLQAEIGGRIDFVICDNTVASWFQTHVNFQADPLVDGVVFPPEFNPPKRTCFRIGRIHDFDVFVDLNLMAGNMYVIGSAGFRKVEVPDWM